MHINSIKAYWEEISKLSGRRAKVFHAIKSIGITTDREIKEKLGFSDMNAVRPRITELIESGLVVEDGSTICPITGKTVRKIKIYKPEPVQMELM